MAEPPQRPKRKLLIGFVLAPSLAVAMLKIPEKMEYYSGTYRSVTKEEFSASLDRLRWVTQEEIVHIHAIEAESAHQAGHLQSARFIAQLAEIFPGCPVTMYPRKNNRLRDYDGESMALMLCIYAFENLDVNYKP